MLRRHKKNLDRTNEKIRNLQSDSFRVKEEYAQKTEKALDARGTPNAMQYLREAKKAEDQIIKISKELAHFKDKAPEAQKTLELAEEDLSLAEGRIL